MRPVFTALAPALFAVLFAVPVVAQSEVVLRPADTEPGLLFGTSVSLDGTGLLVGAPGSNGSVAQARARAYVFRQTPTGWVEEAKLEVPGAGGFGSAVSLAGHLALVGAPTFVHSSGNVSGAAYVFERTASGWGAPLPLLPSDAATATGFGHIVDLESSRLVVAGSNRAYVFERVGGTWTEVAILAIASSTLADMDLSGDRVVLGADFFDDRAKVFEHSETGWDSGKLLNNQGTGMESFGVLVAVDGDRIAVMALSPGCPTTALHGYERLPNKWRKSSVLADFTYVSAVAMDHGRAAVATENSLAVYRSLPDGGWVAEEFHTSSELSNTAGVDLSGNLGVLGQPSDDIAGQNSGAVRIFELASFTGLPEHMTVESGGAQQLELRRGPQHALSLYWIFGSATGTSPGMQADGWLLPLNFDPYFLFLTLNPNTAVQPTIGLLDEQGFGASTIAYSDFDPQLAGIDLRHAFLTFDLAGIPVVDFASQAVPLRLSTESAFAPEDFETGAPGWTSEPGTSGSGAWQIVDDGQCGAVTRMMAYTSAPPNCGASLNQSIFNARLISSPFRPGRVGDYELRFRSRLSSGLDGRVRMVVEGSSTVVFEVAWPTDFVHQGVLQSVSFPVPGIEYAVGRETHFEFVLSGNAGAPPAGWWIDDVELVELP